MRYSLLFIVSLPLVLFAGESPSARDTAGKIYDAVAHENVERVKTYLAADTNTVNFVSEKRFTLLHFAAEHGSSNGTEILKFLLANGAKVEAKNHIGQTPLFSAVIYDNAKGAEILLAHGAKIDVRQDDGRTPLHWAALCGYCDVARVLIKDKAAIRIKNSDGKMPLGLALEEQGRAAKEGDAVLIRRYKETVSLLRESGAKE